MRTWRPGWNIYASVIGSARFVPDRFVVVTSVLPPVSRGGPDFHICVFPCPTSRIGSNDIRLDNLVRSTWHGPLPCCLVKVPVCVPSRHHGGTSVVLTVHTSEPIHCQFVNSRVIVHNASCELREICRILSVMGWKRTFDTFTEIPDNRGLLVITFLTRPLGS